VHVFVVNGFDPLDISGMGETRSTLNRLGFTKVYRGQFNHAGEFADEIKQLAEADPNARFVVVGVGAGVDAAVSLTEAVAAYGVTIDLLASVDSPFWSHAASRKPLNVERVLALHGRPSSVLPWTPSFGEDIELPDASWLGVSSHPMTTETLAAELAMIAGTVPEKVKESLARVEEAPVPRPDSEFTRSPAAATSFLDPAENLEGREAIRRSVPAIPVSRERGQ
jgi:hypothetical protein